MLDHALELMLAKGYSATRIDEVCAAAGVTKGSFYHHFESKEDLARELVDHYFGAVVEGFSEGPWVDELHPTKRALAFFDHAVKLSKGPLLRGGCLLGSFSLDLSVTHPEIREAVKLRLDQLVHVLEPTIRAALKEAGGVPGVNAPVLARQFVSVLQGAIVLAKAHKDPSKLSEGLRCFRVLFEALVGR